MGTRRGLWRKLRLGPLIAYYFGLVGVPVGLAGSAHIESSASCVDMRGVKLCRPFSWPLGMDVKTELASDVAFLVAGGG